MVSSVDLVVGGGSVYRTMMDIGVNIIKGAADWLWLAGVSGFYPECVTH